MLIPTTCICNDDFVGLKILKNTSLHLMPRPRSASHTCTHTFSLHAHGQALLVATVLTAVSLALVNQALLAVSTCVGKIFTDGPLEEAFASLAAVHAVVLSCGNKSPQHQYCFELATCLILWNHSWKHVAPRSIMTHNDKPFVNTKYSGKEKH